MIVVLLEPVSKFGDLIPFRAQIGSGLGRWRGSAAQPRGAKIDVEIDVSEAVDWSGIEVFETPSSTMEIWGQGTEIRGVVLSLNEDGVLTLNLGDGHISLDTIGQPPARLPLAVRVMLPVVEIYPTDT